MPFAVIQSVGIVGSRIAAVTLAATWEVLIVVPESPTVVVGLPMFAQSKPASPPVETSSDRPAVVGARGSATVVRSFQVFALTFGTPATVGVSTAVPRQCVVLTSARPAANVPAVPPYFCTSDFMLRFSQDQ